MEVEALLLALASLAAIASGVAVVRLGDLVYASSALALLGISTAVLAAMLGYPILAAFIVIVYVGAAVMFIIITVSMLGGGGTESRDEWRGVAVGSALLAASAIAFYVTGVYRDFAKPRGSGLDDVASVLLGPMLPAVIVMFAGLAVTVVEAISLARRGG
ncbi:MAG: NADH-quinone oxidoreductase subunit J [Desulfurococcales archaeon]|nr:NADH-quinone oxidoreductase subunit J [Desulfurococcales archaeon]